MSADRVHAPRLFVDASLGGETARVGEREAHYLSHVLRLKRGSPLVAFNGRGEERLATVASLARGQTELRLEDRLAPLAESALDIVLVQGLLKGDAMDSVVHKATELGVRTILAVKTDFSVIKLDAERAARRVAHWERIAQSACEQSRRHRPPAIEASASLAACLERVPAGSTRLAFHQGAAGRLSAVEAVSSRVCLAVGPEGGFSPADLDLLAAFEFRLVGLGARVLRGETAAIAASVAAQLLWGDLG
jgi:16S rRNA (uracil1498-N3)-methyltransferase